MTTNPLHYLMNPSSIATFGASNNFMKMGTMQALSMIKDGYKGKIFPVHPEEKQVLGRKAYASVADLPETPDLAFLVVPASQVIPILKALGQKGTKSAIIVTAGFGETGRDGQKLQDRLNEICEQYGIRFLGPNCMGIINSDISLNTTIAPYPRAKGALGLASQSGTYVSQTISYLGKRGIRFSKAVSVGNSASIDIIDVLEYLGQDEQTRAIALYIESVKDVRRFVEVARRITPHKPVVAQYVGGSGAGARSALSHTGSMAAPDHLYEGMFRQAGVIRVHSIEALYGYGNMLALQPGLEGPRIGILTNSGGPGSAMANELEKAGLSVPQFSQELQSRIRPLIYGHAPCNNPVDMTFHLDIDILTHEIPSIIFESGEVDGLVIHGAIRKGYLAEIYEHVKEHFDNAPVEETFLKESPPISQKTLTLVADHGKPVGLSSFYDRDDDYTAAYQDHGVPVFDSPEKTAGAMVVLYKHFKVRQRLPWHPPTIPVPSAGACELIQRCLSGGQGNLDEYDSKQFLKSWGLSVNEEVLVQTRDEAVAAAKSMDFPLVLKACAPEILHKSGKGLVVLNVNSTDEVAQAYDRIQAARMQAVETSETGMQEVIGDQEIGEQKDGRQKVRSSDVSVLVSRMVRGDREFVAGIVDCKDFGPSIMFGLGGIFTEALNDAVFRPAPVSVADAEEMIREIRAEKLLGPVRGMPAVDTQSLAKMLSRLSLIPLAHPEIREIDINPLIVEGAAPVAVDALVVLSKASII
ncbi:acetate--CoA ligase family protein [Desulfocicer niacini]